MRHGFQPASRRRWLCGAVLLAGQCIAASCWAALSSGDTTCLLSSYYCYVLAQQVPAQVQSLTAQASPETKGDVEASAQEWTSGAQRRIRENLEHQFGSQAREQFESFVAAYANAEGRGDAAYLAQRAAELRLSPAPSNYVDLRKAFLDSRLKPEVEGVSTLLSEIQTWLELKKRRSDVPPLSVWLHRNDKGTPPAPVRPPPPTLSTAEAPPPAEAPDDKAASTSLDALATMRKSRTEKTQQQAQAGMQQVAIERTSAEQEYGAKKLAAAQAQAEDVRRHAEALAQAEKDALDQEANSWSMKVKTVVSSTITAGVGAFTGTVGSQAAQKAADALFPPPEEKK